MALIGQYKPTAARGKLAVESCDDVDGDVESGDVGKGAGGAAPLHAGHRQP